MMGTLATELAGHKIPTHSDLFRADVEGRIEEVRGILRISRIDVHYTLEVPSGKIEDARSALAHYLPKCPAAMSVHECIEITHAADILERPSK